MILLLRYEDLIWTKWEVHILSSLIICSISLCFSDCGCPMWEGDNQEAKRWKKGRTIGDWVCDFKWTSRRSFGEERCGFDFDVPIDECGAKNMVSFPDRGKLDERYSFHLKKFNTVRPLWWISVRFIEFLLVIIIVYCCVWDFRFGLWMD